MIIDFTFLWVAHWRKRIVCKKVWSQIVTSSGGSDEGTTGAGSDKSTSSADEGAAGQTSSVDETVTGGEASGTRGKGKTGRSRANSETGSS